MYTSLIGHHHNDDLFGTLEPKLFFFLRAVRESYPMPLCWYSLTVDDIVKCLLVIRTFRCTFKDDVYS